MNRRHSQRSTVWAWLDFGSVSVVRVLTALSQLIIIAAASKVFGKHDFGLFAISYALARMLASVCGLGTPSYLLKDIPYRQHHLQPWHGTGSVLVWFVAAPLGICVTAGGIFEALREAAVPFYPLEAGQGITVAAVAFTWAMMMTLGAYVRVLRTSTQAMVISELAGPVALLGALGAAVLLERPEVTTTFALASAFLLVCQLSMIAWHILFGWIPIGGEGALPVPYRELLSYWGAMLLNTASGQLDIILAGTIISPQTVGIYAVVKRLANVMAIASSIVVWIFAPRVSRAAAAGDHLALDRAARSAVKLTIGPALIIALVMIVALPLWSSYFEVPRGTLLLTLCALLFGGQLSSMAFGATIMFATQTGTPQLAVRALATAICTAVPLFYLGGYLAGIVGIALGQITLMLTFNAIIRKGLLRKLSIETSVLNILGCTARDLNSVP